MAIFNLLNQREQEFRPAEVIDRYIRNRTKAKSGYINCDEDIIDIMDLITTMQSQKRTGVIHFTLQFEPEELTDPQIAYAIAFQITDYIEQEYHVCFAVHEDTEKIHIHFVFHSICYTDGSRFSGSTQENLCLADNIAEVLNYYGIELTDVFRAVGTRYSIAEPYEKG